MLDQYIPDESERVTATRQTSASSGAAEEQKKASRTGGADWADAHDDMVRLRHPPRHPPRATLPYRKP